MNEEVLRDLQSAIDEVVLCEGRKQVEINSTPKLKYIIAYITGAMSYVNGIKFLFINEQYDSILPLCRCFLEMYAPTCYLIDRYNNPSEFDDFFRKLVVDDMEQDRKIYNCIKTDSTILDETKRQQDMETYLYRWENFIKLYFQNEIGNINQNDKETSLTNIIKQLNHTYSTKYQNICGDKNQFIGNTLENNIVFSNVHTHKYESSYVVYKLLCSETHGNIGAIDSRSSNNGYFSINISNKNNATASVQCIEWCLKDIAYRFEKLFDNQ